jgi:hypothetical protein
MGMECPTYFTLLDRDTQTMLDVLAKQLTQFLISLLPNTVFIEFAFTIFAIYSSTYETKFLNHAKQRIN